MCSVVLAVEVLRALAQSGGKRILADTDHWAQHERASQHATGATALSLGLAVSCGGPEPGEFDTTTAPSLTDRRAAPRAVTLQEFHTSLSQDWVGQLHNDLLRRGLKRLRDEGFEPGQLCTKLREVFSLPEATDPIWRGRYPGNLARLRAQWRDEAGRVGCRVPKDPNQIVTPIAWVSALLDTDSTMSPEAVAIATAMDVERYEATSAWDLATRFTPYISAAQTELSDSGEVATIEALASLAVSSYEYWEQNITSEWGSTVTTIINECEGQPIQACLGEGEWETHAPGASPFRMGPTVFHAASFGRASPCDDQYSAGNTVYRIVLWDAGGAFGRAIGLALKLATGGGGYLAAAAVASGTRLVIEVGSYLQCIYNET